MIKHKPVQIAPAWVGYRVNVDRHPEQRKATKQSYQSHCGSSV